MSTTALLVTTDRIAYLGRVPNRQVLAGQDTFRIQCQSTYSKNFIWHDAVSSVIPNARATCIDRQAKFKLLHVSATSWTSLLMLSYDN